MAEEGNGKGKEKAKPIDFDAEKVNQLLDVAISTNDYPKLIALNKAATINLAIISAEVEEQLEKRAEEMQKKAEAESAKKAKEAEQPPAHQLPQYPPAERRF